MEAILADCEQKSLPHFMHVIFLCQRLCAEFPTELLASKSSEMASTDDISEKLKSSSDLVLSRQDEKVEKSDKDRFSDIKRLVKGKTFSRNDLEHQNMSHRYCINALV